MPNKRNGDSDGASSDNRIFLGSDRSWLLIKMCQLIVHRIGINTQKDILQLLNITRVIPFQPVEVLHKQRLLLLRIIAMEFRCSVPQVVSYVVVRIQPVSTVDPRVEQLGNSPVIFVVRHPLKGQKVLIFDRSAEFDMHPTLVLHDAGQYACQVFPRFFGVFGELRFVQFQGLQDIA